MGKTEVEISAKTIDEAIVAGCAALGVGMDEVDFEITDQGGIFRKMKVKISLKEKPAEEKEEVSEDTPTIGAKANKKPADKTPTGAMSQIGAADKTPTGGVTSQGAADAKQAKKNKKSGGGEPVTTQSDVSEVRAEKTPYTNKVRAAATPEINGGENAYGGEKKSYKTGKIGGEKDTATHEVIRGATDEFIIEGRERQARRPRVERPVTEFDPNASKFAKTLEFVTKLFGLLDESLTITTDHNDREFIIEVHGENVSRLIGKEGHTLACINTLVTSVAINNANGEGRRVVVDIENYRDKRRQSLIELGKRKAEWVIQSGKTVKLEPMPARERVLIHTALQDIEGVTTHSHGDEPNRYLIISPSAR